MSVRLGVLALALAWAPAALARWDAAWQLPA